jgi:hypothetical protein
MIAVTKPVVVGNFDGGAKVPLFVCKNADFNHVLDSSIGYVNDVLLFYKENLMDLCEHRFITVDVKWGYVKKSEFPCIEGWHCDTVQPINMEKGVSEKHYIISDNNQTTEFYVNDYQADPERLWSDISLDIGDDEEFVYKPNAGELVRYYRENMHRCPKFTENCHRLLIRISETDIIRPNRRLRYL